MGIYDREYYRREGPSFLGSFAEQGKVCKRLILINVAVFVLQWLGIHNHWPIKEVLWLDPEKVLHGEVWRLLTYAFVHDPNSLMHILFNMLFLWWFGHVMEEIYRPREFLAFYLVSAVLGGLAFMAWAGLQVDSGPVPVCMGASGAVTAVMVLFALHYPRHTILLMMVLPIPIWAFVGFQVVQDLFIFVSNEKTGTAVTVHLAGAAFGFLYYKGQWRIMNLFSWLDLSSRLRQWQRQRSRPRLRVYREEETPVHVTADPASLDVDEQLEAKLDAVLEKVARTGQASLTESERQVLLHASEVFKRRRT